MEYLPLFLLLMAALIAGYFYLERAKARDAKRADAGAQTASPAATDESADPSA